MIELPEAYVLSRQIDETLVGKTIRRAAANTHPHGFAMYSGDPAAYDGMLAGKKILESGTLSRETCSCDIVGILCEDMLLTISTPIKYHPPGAKLPKSHQLLLEFDDGSHMSCTVQMWGGMHCVPLADKPRNDNEPPSPYDDDFNAAYFDGLVKGVKPSMSAKALLATEQRIPGLGNGVVQDILFNAGIHPKRKIETMSDADLERLYTSVKTTLHEMRAEGGRDTERDLFNCYGGYRTKLSKKTIDFPCGVCGGGLVRQAFLGGNIYFCPVCQPLG